MPAFQNAATAAQVERAVADRRTRNVYFRPELLGPGGIELTPAQAKAYFRSRKTAVLVGNWKIVGLEKEVRTYLSALVSPASVDEILAAGERHRAASPKRAAQATEHPPYREMIAKAINELKETQGSSRQAIKKFIHANFKVGANADQQITLALRRGVVEGFFLAPKGMSGTFKVSKGKRAASPKRVASPKRADQTSPVRKVHKASPRRKSPPKTAPLRSLKQDIVDAVETYYVGEPLSHEDILDILVDHRGYTEGDAGRVGIQLESAVEEGKIDVAQDEDGNDAGFVPKRP